MLTFALRSVAVLTVIAAVSASAAACPFCPVTSPTLGEQQAQSDVVILAQWVGGEPKGDEQTSYTTYEVLQTHKTPAGLLNKGTQVNVSPFYEGKPGNLFLLMAKQEETLKWDAPQEVTETSWQYVAQAPTPESPQDKRLAYFARFLEYPDDFIAADAFAEFTRAKYEDVAPLGKAFSRDKVRGWLASEKTPQPRLGFYGMLLGLCGTADDAVFLMEKIQATGDPYRLGVDGVMGGYLLLTGERGLEILDRTILAKPESPVSEVMSVMSALRFFWTYGEGRIVPERLQRSMRLLLDRDDVRDLVIMDLARWKDWSVQDRLVRLYDAPTDDASSRQRVRVAIITYLLAAQRDAPDDAAASVPPHVTHAREALATLRQRDPATVSRAERFGL